MHMAISKKYSPDEVEDKWYQTWLDAKVFRSVPDEREPYTIVIPPPNVTGILHMGHVLNNTLQDVLIRRKRMLGFNACWVPGTDHASIATEAKVVKMLADQGIDKRDIGREAFLGHARQWKDKYGGIILSQLKKLGASCDWERTSYTMNPEYSDSVIKVFCDLYDKGLIYRGIRMVNWDPQAQTAVSDEEVYYKNIQGNLYHIRYAIEGETDTYLTIATTRPETMLGDTAIAIHPEDERYTHLHGKRVRVPLINRSIPIILDEYVKMDFGTGCLKVTPAHDPNDYEIGIRKNLDSIDIFNDDGTINEAGQRYIGEDRFKARKLIVKDLEAAGQLAEVEPHLHEVGHSERTHVPIEPKISMQWFMRMEDLAKPALEAVENGTIQLIPGKFINTYRHWMENVRDWCLSRQLWWGHRIPAWYIKDSNQLVVAPTEEEALEKAQDLTGRPRLTLEDLEQDPDVLDTWASSWLWPISVFNGETQPDNPEFAYYFPTQDLVTAPEILFFWVARMIIAGYELKGVQPFSHVYLHGIVRDKQRRKMSKSLGNSPDPLELIAEYGADAVRVGMLKSSPAGNDLLFDISLVEEGRRDANKIWNAFRLIKGWETTEEPPSDREQWATKWMDARIHEVHTEINDHFEKFRISDALMSVRKLIWDDFSQFFLEAIKPPYGAPISQTTLEQCIVFFERALQLLHPFMPFITEEIWHGLRERAAGDLITVSQIVDPQPPDMTLLKEIELIRETITAVRSFRKEKGLSPKEEIELMIKTEHETAFAPYFALLQRFLNTSNITFVEEKVQGAGSLRVQAHECFIPLGNVDIEAEREKIQKEITYMEGFLKQVQNKLSNERFVANAPEKVVNMERKKEADAQEKLAVLRESLKQLS